MPIRPENRDRYPKDWLKISRRIRLVRAQSQCECVGECGRNTHRGRCPNRQGLPAYGTGSRVILTVAHLNHTPEDCRDENLRAMCQGCHLHLCGATGYRTAARSSTGAANGGSPTASTD
ncbi:hypothetical protein [Mycobacteroides abscessus]|uniref:hypothetical protein n=1 Tax=Mycobacteroides abscessus TaxID=36809 RepID=UPI00355C52D7